MIRRVLIGDNERVLVIRKRRFETILGPGEHWVFGRDVELVRAKVSDLVEDANKKLQKNLDKAQAASDKEDTKNAVKELLKNFKEDVVGLDAQEGSIRLYHEIMDNLRDQKDELLKKGDVDGLKELGKIVKKTELEKEVDEAMEAAKNAAVENPKTGK